MDNPLSPDLQRIPALDTARGVAVLGILLINMYSFAVPEVVRANPLLMTDASGLDRVFWYLLHIFADTKFITMLSVVFGASLWFFGEQKPNENPELVDALQNRRSIWLLVFGLLHSYFLWEGDVLFTYAVCAFVAWRWRFLSDDLLIKISVTILVIFGVPSLLMTAFFPEAMNEWTAYQTADEIAEEIALYRQGWAVIAAERIGVSINLQLGVIVSGWISLAAMLVGIVLARRGFLSLHATGGDYRKLITVTFVPGVLLVAIGLGKSIQHDFAASYVYGWGYELHFWGSTLIGISYLLMVMLWCRSGSGHFLRRILAAVGRMALTIYIMQSLICTLLFYGYGLGLYGHLSLAQIVWVVVGIWVLQCVFACWWLNRFHHGPLEWLWRYLVYRGSVFSQ